MTDDPLEGVLDIEDGFYRDGYRQGAVDGQKAGQAEGRTLGLENAFKMFSEGGRLYGRAVVWANRLPQTGETGETGTGAGEAQRQQQPQPLLPRLPASARVQRNIRALYALVEPGTLSTSNTDSAVNDFESRVKRAQGKLRVVERLIGDVEAAKQASPQLSPPPSQHGGPEQA